MTTDEKESKGCQALPPHACPECGTQTELSRVSLTLPVNGEAITVPRIPHRRCPECGESLLSLDAATRLQEAAHATYRKRHGLLTPEEIRDLRESLALSQVQLAALLQLGANTLSRWESGKVVQSTSLDTLLRLLRDVPGTRDYLERRVA